MSPHSYTKTVTNALSIHMKSELKDEINFTEICSSELFVYISWKVDFPENAERAFRELVFRFETDLLKKSEILCSKFNYSAAVALQIAECTFARVWKYPSFEIIKAKGKTIESSIQLWLYRIFYTQLIKYGKENHCSEPSEEEDLSLINNLDEYLSTLIDDEDVETMSVLKAKYEFINSALLNLSDKHRIIYFTYKAYEIVGKNLPEPIRKQLKETLGLTQGSIRRYKSDANEAVKNYITLRNVKR